MKLLPIKNLLVSALFAGAVGVSHGSDQSERAFIGSWQFGLTKDVRHLPNGQAFRAGVTGAVLTLNADKTLRMEPPCRDEEFIKKVGGIRIAGNWELKDGSFSLTLKHEGENAIETFLLAVNGDEMTLTPTKGKARRLGRFDGNTSSACEL